jgi:exopolysaccharide production protein ExoZ
MARDSQPAEQSLISLEILRFSAAIMVVFAHFPAVDRGWMQYLLGARHFVGSIGVDIFFVVSGVVMGVAARRSGHGGALEAGVFMASRFFRIFPLYWLMTFLALAAGVLVEKGLPTWGHMACSFLLVPCLTEGRYADPVIGLGWTLRYEIYFYALTALSIFFRLHWLPVVWIVLTVMVRPMWLDYYAQPIALEFAFGYLLATFVPWLVKRGSAMPRGAGWAALTGAVVLVVLASTGKDFPPDGRDLARTPRMLIYWGPEFVLPRMATWGIAAMVLTSCCVFMERAIPRWLFRLGTLTYSVYMLQYFVLPLAGRFLDRGLGVGASVGLTLALLIAASWLSFTYFEHPINSWWRHKKRRFV